MRCLASFFRYELLSFFSFSSILIPLQQFRFKCCRPKKQILFREKMSQLVLYHWVFSPFSRAVLQLCRYMKIDVEVRQLDLFKGEHMTEEYLALNPLHTVPFIIDGDFKLSESKAIMQYLMESRAPHFVAASPKERATINQRLMFEEGKVCAGYFKIVVR